MCNVKQRCDFETEDEYLEYVATPEFMERYSIKNKTIQDVMEEMRFPKEWLSYVKVVYERNIAKERYEGIYLYYDVEVLVIDNEDYESSMDELIKIRSEGGEL